MQRWFSVPVLVPVLVATSQAEKPPLRDEIKALQAVYRPALSAGGKLALDGALAQANEALVNRVPDKEKTAAHYLFLGNVLFSVDHKLSYRFHEQAYRMRPDDALARLEWAIEQHRAGQLPGAIRTYEKYLESEPSDEKIYALLADCLIRTNDFRGAVNAWQKARHDRHHIAIESAIHWIYGAEAPQTRRNKLLGEIRAGQLDRIENLIVLDLTWDRDWWNQEVNKKTLERDLDEIRRLLKDDAPRRAAIEALASFRLRQTKPQEFERALLENKIIVGPDARLPASSLLTSAIMADLLSKRLSSRTALYSRHATELWRRGENGDGEALNVLANLATEADKDRLPAIDKLGWDKGLGDKFAASYLVAYKGSDLDSLLKKAHGEYPNNPVIALKIMRMAKDSRTLDASGVAAVIRAEYASGFMLSQLRIGTRGSYVLKGLFVTLDNQLKR